MRRPAQLLLRLWLSDVDAEHQPEAAGVSLGGSRGHERAAFLDDAIQPIARLEEQKFASLAPGEDIHEPSCVVWCQRTNIKTLRFSPPGDLRGRVS